MARELAEEDAIPNDWRTRQPGFAVWVVIAVPRVALSASFYSIYYIPSSQRQNRKWTYRQAFMTQVVKKTIGIITELGFTESVSLSAGKLGKRWVVIDPAEVNADYGLFLSNKVRPEKIGGSWYPDPPPANQQDEKSLIILSFHSGSFLWLTGRPEDSGYTADLLNRKMSSSARSLWVQYRLAGGRDPTPYPGPMQDAVTAYVYLVKTLGISPRRIVLVGDSSGATIAMALLRYLAENVDDDDVLASLPPPKACLMFSPSVEYSFEGDSHALNSHRNHRTDYCEGRMMAWGTRAFAPPAYVRLDSPDLSPALHPFATPVPLFVQAGAAEVLCDSIKGFAKAMGAIPGNKVEYMEVPDVPHDIYIAGHILGWSKEQEEIIDAAANFVSRL